MIFEQNITISFLGESQDLLTIFWPKFVEASESTSKNLLTVIISFKIKHARICIKIDEIQESI